MLVWMGETLTSPPGVPGIYLTKSPRETLSHVCTFSLRMQHTSKMLDKLLRRSSRERSVWVLREEEEREWETWGNSWGFRVTSLKTRIFSKNEFSCTLQSGQSGGGEQVIPLPRARALVPTSSSPRREEGSFLAKYPRASRGGVSFPLGATAQAGRPLLGSRPQTKRQTKIKMNLYTYRHMCVYIYIYTAYIHTHTNIYISFIET